MEFDTLTGLSPERLKVKISRKDHSTEPFAQNVLNGLSAQQKWLSAKFLYDEHGSVLFEQICDLRVYYPTRTERSILMDRSGEISELCEHEVSIVELGSGSSTKTTLLLEAFLEDRHDLYYIPIDISRSILVDSARSLLHRYDNLHITALVSDYFTALAAIKERQKRQKLIIFLGSSIGNYEKHESDIFLKKIRATMAPNDMLLIGMDLLKSEDILIPAYDDALGVTAAFNLNILERINRELDGDFDLPLFRHQARFNRRQSRVEMHLESIVEQTVTVGELGKSFRFEKGETIHTENSTKYTPEGITAMAERCGFRVKKAWYDQRKWFSLNLFVPV